MAVGAARCVGGVGTQDSYRHRDGGAAKSVAAPALCQSLLIGAVFAFNCLFHSPDAGR